MLAKAFGECQCASDCVRVGFLDPPPSGPLVIAPRECTFGLFPKISTPVEKTVEIPRDLRQCSAFSLISQRFLPGRSSRIASNRAFWTVESHQGPENRLPQGAKGRRSPF